MELWDAGIHMTLTGNYLKDREYYPGFWEIDVPNFYAVKRREERFVEKAVEELKKRRAKSG